jgi:hypothetical protein
VSFGGPIFTTNSAREGCLAFFGDLAGAMGEAGSRPPFTEV